MVRVAPRFLIFVLALAGVLAVAAAAHGPLAKHAEPVGGEISAPALLEELGKRVGLEDVCGGCEKDGSYCAKPIGQCGADAPGACKIKPQACTREYRPVCSCDGKTYANPCVAAADGANIARPGPCAQG